MNCISLKQFNEFVFDKMIYFHMAGKLLIYSVLIVSMYSDYCTDKSIVKAVPVLPSISIFSPISQVLAKFNKKFITFIIILVYLNVTSLARIIFGGPGLIRKRENGKFNLDIVKLCDGTIITIDCADGCRKVHVPIKKYIPLGNEGVEIDSPYVSLVKEADCTESFRGKDHIHEKISEVDLCSSDNNSVLSYECYREAYCSSCNIFRPPGISHCSYCRACIYEKDHHCPSLNVCIGRNNYPYFMVFIKTDFVLCLIIFYIFFTRYFKKSFILFAKSTKGIHLLEITKRYLTFGFFSILQFCILLKLAFTGFVFFRFHYLYIYNLKSREFILGLRKGKFEFKDFIIRTFTNKSPIRD